jgi:hypothetical protein
MIDADLAGLYQVTTGNLNLAVKRNLDRFPKDFMFQITREEFEALRFHYAISNRGARRYLPYAKADFPHDSPEAFLPPFPSSME